MRMGLFFVVACVVGCGAATEDGGDEIPEPRTPLVGPGSATHPAFSPDGSTLAFMSNMEGVLAEHPINFEIYVTDLEAGTPIRLTEKDAFDADIAWSPDGESTSAPS